MIEVTRIIVYRFKDNETAEKHMESTTVPMNGAKIFGNVEIRSAAFVELFREDWEAAPIESDDSLKNMQG
jgi:hypothetical protein